uniref:zinc finger BED domain-containing protein 4-like n=1 Tax=Styela clava TaxID=7725 RepID=UPI00193A5E68|nr:zinc finger BED domain-containing protein 4-like [Styela clava]
MSSPKAKSLAWQYFKICEDDCSKAECGICATKISRGKCKSSYTTSSMLKHLSTCHQVFEKPDGSKRVNVESTAAAECSSRQPTIVEALSKRKLYDNSHPVSRCLTSKIGEMIALDFMPYSMVENVGFLRLVKELNARYTIPSRKYFSNTVVPGIYDKVTNKIKELLKSAVGPICATTDEWTSLQNDSFMSITSNFLIWNKGDLHRVTPVLSCSELVGSQTAELLLSEIRRQESEWGVSFATITSDNASNVIKALKDGEIFNIRCMAHTLNLIVHDAIRSNIDVKDIVADARSLIAHYNRSSRDARALRECQKRLNAPEHKLQQDVSTRWNSTYYALERMVEQREVINDMSFRGIGNTLSPNQWRMASSLIRVLKLFDIATKEVCTEEATIASILPVKENLLKRLEAFIGDSDIYGLDNFLNSLKSGIERRFSVPGNGPQPRDAYFQNQASYNRCLLATILDPRLKLSWCSTINRQEIERLLVTEVKKFATDSVELYEGTELYQSSSSEEAEDSVVFGAPENAGLVREQVDMDADIVTAVRQYLAAPTLKRHKSPLVFWPQY